MKVLGLIYMATGVFFLAVCIGATIYAAAGGNLLVGTLKSVERLFSGITGPANVSAVSDFILPGLALALLSIILIMIGGDLRRDNPLLPEFHGFWRLLVAVLIGLELCSCFVLGVFDSVLAIIPLAFIFVYTFIREKLYKVDFSVAKPLGAVGKSLFFRYSLIIVTVLIIGEFILVAYLHHRFPGQLYEF